VKPLVVIGGGEHARVVIEAARGQWDVIGFVDPQECGETTRRLGVPRLGDDDYGMRAAKHAHVVLGVGTIGVGDVRARVAARYAEARWASIVHAAATVSPTASIGPGAVVLAGAIINSGANIGSHCVINTGAVVEHDCVLSAFSQVGPAAALGGGVTVGEGSYLGLGCRVRDHVAIGARTLIAMGAVVTRSTGDGESWRGVPAKPHA
jgi:sugar O-acyltransferase (sialic acid O-acetyltransferase NeuD family)